MREPFFGGLRESEAARGPSIKEGVLQPILG
jgi:hypothetical protein